MRYAILFPGQGSQAVGMGADVFTARPDLLGDAADAVLGWSLREMCAVGPEGELTRTDRAQPALYAVGYALWEEFRAAMSTPPAAAAGHSLGEYTALAAAGALTFHDGLSLVAARGRAMDEAARADQSGMAALLGADAGFAEEIAAARRETGGRLWVANLNAPGQVVLAGSREDIEWLAGNASELGARRAIPLKVAGAFHSPFMASAAERLGSVLASVAFSELRFPVYANTTGMPIGDIAATLAEQLVGPVRFAEGLERMAADGIEAFVHIGPGDVTAGMARRTVSDALVLTVSGLDDIEAVREALTVQ